jgi:hypothetical protein
MKRAVPIGLAATCGTLLAASPAMADGPVVRAVEKSVPVAPGTVTSSTVDCPRGMTALAGGVRSRPTGSILRASMPSSPGRWRFRFGALVGARSHAARVVVRCARLQLPAGEPGLDLRVHTATRRVPVTALSSATTTLSCRRGFFPTGWGFEERPPGSPEPLGPEEVQVFKALAGRSRYELGLENTGSAGEVVTVRMRCLERRVVTKHGFAHSFRVRRPVFSNRLGRGVRRLSHSCPLAHFALGAGHSIDPRDDILYRRSYTGGTRTGHWVFEQTVGSAQRVQTQLVCLDLRTTFARG